MIFQSTFTTDITIKTQSHINFEKKNDLLVLFIFN